MTTLSSTVRDAFEALLSHSHTCMVGTIISYDIATNSANVQPSLMAIEEDGTTYVRPPIMHVPIVFPSTRNSAIVFPIQYGDSVLLVISERSLIKWKLTLGVPTGSDADVTSETSADLHSSRQFDYNDAIAIPGCFPFATSIASPDKHQLARSLSDLTITHNLGASGKEAQIKMTNGGTIEINAGVDSTIIMDQDGQVTINAVTKMTLNATTLLEVNAPQTNWTGNITQTGNMARAGNSINTGLLEAAGIGIGVTPVSGQAKITGDIAVTGNVGVTGDTTHTGNVTANGKNISDTHTHSGVTPGVGNTGTVV
jgi:hypothetical protein